MDFTVTGIGNLYVIENVTPRTQGKSICLESESTKERAEFDEFDGIVNTLELTIFFSKLFEVKTVEVVLEVMLASGK